MIKGFCLLNKIYFMKILIISKCTSLSLTMALIKGNFAGFMTLRSSVSDPVPGSHHLIQTDEIITTLIHRIFTSADRPHATIKFISNAAYHL